MTTKELLNTKYSFNNQDLFFELPDASCKPIKINMVLPTLKLENPFLQKVKRQEALWRAKWKSKEICSNKFLSTSRFLYL